ncbi:acyl-CoA synthetase [Shewanella sp. NFH-SH190041]|uniref:acyl-CoA synthetase n=1 Tax=Shewanella sp. NFH-SH190041 TaxID=2950245 RepID=UPI0021C3A4FF|nr:acyl-CoA synthetase [Shewanella sp. NFH-SH190041]BDM64397.1 acyl-CoA synthetase [Shewanella sp. NFH-SH190041]
METMGIWQMAKQQPQALALVAPDGKHWSRAELVAESNRLVHGLRDLGLKQGDTVAAVLTNSAEFIALYLAVTQSGMFLVPLNWHLAGPEIAYILKDSGAAVLIYDDAAAEASATAVKASGFNPQHCFKLGKPVDGVKTYHQLVAGQADALPVDRATGMVMFYTSGTTGKPKGVRRPVPGIDPDTMATNMAMFPQLFGIMPQQGNVHYSGSPLYHTAAMTWVTNSLHLGHSVVLHDKWDAEGMLAAIDRFGVTTTHVVPTQLVRLLKLPAEVRSRYDVSSMQHMLHTAAPCAPQVKREIIDWFGPCIYEYYACTEGGGAICNTEQWLANPGTVGKAWCGADIKIFDDKGDELPVGEQGTIYMLMTDVSRFEYRGDSKKTAGNRVGDYFTAGDVGYLNEDGFLFLCDRKTDMIISGGANIYPAEIENVLILHPKVADCAVFGIPNADWGEEVKAVIQPIDGVVADGALTDELMTFIAGKLAKMKWPKSIDFSVKLPRDPNGKLYKRRLKAPYWA